MSATRWNWGSIQDGDYTSTVVDADQKAPDVAIYHCDTRGPMVMSWLAAVELRRQLDRAIRFVESEGFGSDAR